jgi:hypothetical protein
MAGLKRLAPLNYARSRKDRQTGLPESDIASRHSASDALCNRVVTRRSK